MDESTKENHATCNHVNESGLRCFRQCVNSSFCKKHTREIEYNTKCPICLEEEGEWFLLSCYHKVHIECLKGMVKAICPTCRAETNFPPNIKDSIENNAKKYEEEKIEEERREILSMLDQEFDRRPPPQMEIVVALRYLYELGIPPFLIPETITIHIDPTSALPTPGFIFQNTVREILNHIHMHSETADIFEEDGSVDGSFEDSEEEFERNPIYKILTVPITPEQNPSPEDRPISYVDRRIFNTISFNVENVEISQELYDLFVNEIF